MMYSVKDKQHNLTMLNNQMLTKTLIMFEWENLPPTIPKRELEKQLQINGYSFITKINGELWAVTGALGGELDPYGNPTQIIINNPSLKFSKTLSLKDDGVLVRNDDLMMGLIPTFTRYNSQIIENDINLNMLGLATRSQIVLSASDNKTKQQAELFLKKLVDGELSVIGENMMTSGVKALNLSPNSSSQFNGLIEFNQYLKGSLFNEIGIKANSVMKRERLTANEVTANDDTLFTFIYNMLSNRLQAVEQIKEMFGEVWGVDFGSVWKVNTVQKIDDIIEPITEPTDEPNNEPKDEPKDEQTNEPTDEPNNEQTAGGERDTLIEWLESGDFSDDDLDEIREMIKGLGDES